MREEFRVALDLDDGGLNFPALFRASCLGSVGWFDLLRAEGWIGAVLGDAPKERREWVLRWLGSVAAQRAEEIATVLRCWWSGDQERGHALLEWFAFATRGADDEPLRGLCANVVRSCTYQDGHQGLQHMILHNWVVKRPEHGSEILRACFDAWFEQHPGHHPFEREFVRNRDEHEFAEIAKASPRVFLEGAGPALARTARMIAERERSGTRDFTFSRCCRPGENFGADALFALYRQSLKVIVEADPILARGLLRLFDPGVHRLLLHLHLETIAASKGALASDFLALLGEPELLEAGWNGTEWKSFADSARVSLPHLSTIDRKRVEDSIVSLEIELNEGRECAAILAREGEGQWRNRGTVLWSLSRSGHTRWAILETIGADLLSPEARAVLGEGRRKFANEGIPKPHGLTGGWVQSPIARERAIFMSDAHWLRAMEKHATNDGRPRRKLLEGGASQLGSELRNLTKQDPARFAALLTSIPESANSTYIDHILWGLAEAETAEIGLAAGALLLAHARTNRPHGWAIVRLFEQYPKLAELPRLLDVLVWYGDHGAASESEAVEDSATTQEMVTINDLLDKGSKLYARAIGSVRGSAAEAFAKVVWDVPAVADAAWAFTERRIKTETLPSVRCCLVRLLLALFNFDRERAVRLLESLTAKGEIDADVAVEFAGDHRIAPLATHAATHLLPYVLAQAPEAGQRLTDRLLESDDETFKLIGAWHIIGASLSNDGFRKRADELIAGGGPARQLAAAIASDVIAHEG